MSYIDYRDMVFSKEKMLERLKREGRTDMITAKSMEIMDQIDGLPVEKNHFKALVYDELEFIVMNPVDKLWTPVNINDCVKKVGENA